MTIPDPDVRELAAKALFDAERRLPDEADWDRLDPEDRYSYWLAARAVLAVVDPVIRREERAKTAEEIARNLDKIAESCNPVYVPPEYAQESATNRIRRDAFWRAAEVARSHANQEEADRA